MQGLPALAASCDRKCRLGDRHREPADVLDRSPHFLDQLLYVPARLFRLDARIAGADEIPLKVHAGLTLKEHEVTAGPNGPRIYGFGAEPGLVLSNVLLPHVPPRDLPDALMTTRILVWLFRNIEYAHHIIPGREPLSNVWTLSQDSMMWWMFSPNRLSTRAR